MAQYGFYLPDNALQRVRMKLDQMKLAGKTVTPMETRALYQAEMDALAGSAQRERAMDIQQNQFQAGQSLQREQNQSARDIAMNQGNQAAISSYIQPAATLGAGVLGVRALTGKYPWNFGQTTPTTPVNAFTGAGSANSNPATFTSPQNASISQWGPQPGNSTTYATPGAVEPPASLSSDYSLGNSTLYPAGETAPAAAGAAETGTTAVGTAAPVVDAGSIAADSTAGAASLTGAAPWSSYFAPVGAGLLGGELGAAGGRWVGDQLGIGGERERSTIGGMAGGAAAGAGVGMLGGPFAPITVPVGAGVGALVGGVSQNLPQIGSALSDVWKRSGLGGAFGSIGDVAKNVWDDVSSWF
jgi:hypothetical protein